VSHRRPGDNIGIASVACVVGVAACFAFAGSGRASVSAKGIPTEEAQVVLDTSASVAADYRLQALRAIALVAADWPRPVPASGASSSRPQLVVQVRGVSADSYDPASVLGAWVVEGIPAVEGLPSDVTADFTQRVIAFKREHTAAVSAYRRALTDARRAAAALRALRPKTTYASEIEGAVSAAAQSFSPSGIRRLVIVSDLAQNRPPQIAGSLRGVRVLIAHICSDVSTCQRQEHTWLRTLRARGAASVDFVRVERFPAAIASFLGSS
jgi:hypothetical protein